MINIIKLITGEEIVCDLEEKGDTYIAKAPCTLQWVPSKSNPEQPMMGLVPYAVYTEDHMIEVNKSAVVWIEKPVKELFNQYNSAFGSGIQLATL